MRPKLNFLAEDMFGFRAAFSAGPGVLIRAEGIMNRFKYQSILEQNVKVSKKQRLIKITPTLFFQRQNLQKSAHNSSSL